MKLSVVLVVLCLVALAVQPAEGFNERVKLAKRTRTTKTAITVRDPPCDKLGVDIKQVKKLGGGVAGRAFLLETGSVAKVMLIGGTGNTKKEKEGFICLANAADQLPFFLAYGDAGVALVGDAHVFECPCAGISTWEIPDEWKAENTVCQFEIMEAFSENFEKCSTWADAKKLTVMCQAVFASAFAFAFDKTKWVQMDPLPINYGFKAGDIGKICLKNKAGDKIRCFDTAAEGGGVVKLFDFDKSNVAARTQMLSLASFKLNLWKECGVGDVSDKTSFDAIFSSSLFDTLPAVMDGATTYQIP
jgi:hypothetical protein